VLGYKSQSLSRSFVPAPAKLVVHEVGAFIASFVPTRADFTRLDERFRMPDNVWDQLPQYADWGFAVVQLAPKKKWWGGTKTQSIHPIAMTFPTREPGALYFPLTHVHDGAHVDPEAHFDHALYCQADGVVGATLEWGASIAALGTTVDGPRCHGLVDGGRGGFAEALEGKRGNADLWLRAPAGITVDDLTGQGETYRYAAKLGHAYAHAHASTVISLDERWRRWCTTARDHAAALCHGLRDGLRELTAARRQSWQLAPLTDDLPVHFINGRQLWTGTSYMDGSRVESGGGPGRVTFTPFSDRVAMQSVTLGFASLPDQEGVDEIINELSRLLDRAVPL
jgi:hypothetical protein